MNVPKLILCFVMCPLFVAASVADSETTVQRMRFDAPPFEIVDGGNHSSPSLQDLAICIDWEADGVQPLKHVGSLSAGHVGTPGEHELRFGNTVDYKIRSDNTDDFHYAVYPVEASPSGETGVLKFSFKTKSYFGTASLMAQVPAFDAVGSTVRLWFRHTPGGEVPSPSSAIQVEFRGQLRGQSMKLLESWKFYQDRFPSGDWHYVEVRQGDRSGTVEAKHHVVADVGPNDLNQVSDVHITFIGYNTETGDDFYFGGLDVIPAVYAAPRQVKNLAGAWRLRPEGGVDGEGKRWFDPALDHAGFGEEVALGFWDAKNDPVAWYRKIFSLTPEMREKIQDRKVFLLFFGVDESCWLWLNGQRLGSHSEDRKDGWDKPFAVNVTEHLRTEGENVLAVKVLNRQDAGGIWKPVWLVVEE